MELSQPSALATPVCSGRGPSTIKKEKRFWNSGNAWTEEHRSADGANPYHALERTLGRTAQALRLKVLHHIELAEGAAYEVALRAARAVGRTDPEKPRRRSGGDYAEDNKISAQRALDHFNARMQHSGAHQLSLSQKRKRAADFEQSVAKRSRTSSPARAESDNCDLLAISASSNHVQASVRSHSHFRTSNRATNTTPVVVSNPGQTKLLTLPSIFNNALGSNVMYPSGLPRQPAINSYAARGMDMLSTGQQAATAEPPLRHSATVAYPKRILPRPRVCQAQNLESVAVRPWAGFSVFDKLQTVEPMAAPLGPISSLAPTRY
ncbi:hypothetical protein B0A48_01103 [Cryoendolithus antarcticus]|uniref:Uncharacterized protein n=1 Tax=Cryoendolithus antarcticus TaxID=1507870 RepID=A0A1V8TSC6_9PEZI|nr:hypothetical protein B0A48_01103 [Cryoendolithus antarcticus]